MHDDLSRAEHDKDDRAEPHLQPFAVGLIDSWIDKGRQ